MLRDDNLVKDICVTSLKFLRLLYQRKEYDTIVSELMERGGVRLIHISADKRSVGSAQRIGQGMLQCLQQKPFSEITVTDVQRASTVGRATFYRLFDHTADVLTYLCDGVFVQAGEEIQRLTVQSADGTTLAFIRAWEQNRVLLKAIVDSGRMDILLEAHQKHLSSVADGFLRNEGQDEAQAAYLMTTLTACMAAFLTAWIKNGAAEDAQQLQVRLKACFRALGDIFA